MNTTPIIFRGLLAMLLMVNIATIGGCSKSAPESVKPTEIARGTVCSLDGMTLADFPGPKAQIYYENQKDPVFFCNTMELFSIYLRPEEQRRIRAVFVQDMSKASWNEPKGNWIDARSAFYVAGSKLQGSMGPTLASFASEADANAFIGKQGGKLFRFNQITPDMVTQDGGVLKDHQE